MSFIGVFIVKIIKIGLKSNANFLFSQMNGNTLGGTSGGKLWVSILHVSQDQFKKFKILISAFGGKPESLQKSDNPDVDYECYFKKEN